MVDTNTTPKAFEFSKDEKFLIVRIPVKEQVSKTGKMILIASSGGWTSTPLVYKTKEVRINITAGINNTKQ